METPAQWNPEVANLPIGARVRFAEHSLLPELCRDFQGVVVHNHPAEAFVYVRDDAGHTRPLWKVRRITIERLPRG